MASAHQAFVDEITQSVLGRISLALTAASRNGTPRRGQPRKRVKAVAEGEQPKRKRGRPKKSEQGSQAEHEQVAVAL